MAFKAVTRTQMNQAMQAIYSALRLHAQNNVSKGASRVYGVPPNVHVMHSQKGVPFFFGFVCQCPKPDPSHLPHPYPGTVVESFP